VGIQRLRNYWKKLRNSTLAQNALSLYGVQFAYYAAPVVTVPYLARVLGPYHWGLVAFAQSFGLYTALIVEFGFSLSATREVARGRGDHHKLAEIFAGVAGAKAALSAICVLMATAIVIWVPQFRGKRLLMYAGAASGIAQAYSVAWFYQGLERMRTASAIDILGKMLFVLSVLVFVHTPRDDWRVLCLQCFWYGAATLVLTVIVHREFPLHWPALEQVREALKSSASMFLYRSALTLYRGANTLLLGFLVTPVSLAYYAAAEKINNVSLGIVMPLSRAVYPRMSHLAEHDEQAAARLARVSVLLNLSLGWLLCAGLYVFAPFLVRIVLGRAYGPVIPIVRIMALLLPAVACSLVLGCQCMLPLKMDREFTIIAVIGGLFNISAALILVPRYSYFGMAWSVVMTEVLVTLCQLVVLVRRAPHFVFAIGPRLRAAESGE
jgi:PST family polysaccharide transporter